MGFSQFVLKDDFKKYYQALSKAVEKGEIKRLELRLRNIISYFYANIEIMPIYERKDEMYRLVITDISESKKAEEKLREAHDNLEEKVKERTVEFKKEIEMLMLFIS